MIFDTHTHYNDHAFDEDRETVIKTIMENGIGAFTEVAASMEGSRSAVALANAYDNVYASVGVHPDDIGTLTEADMDELKLLSKEKKVVAIGEIGLDYHYLDYPEDVQKRWFERQIELAKEVDLPIIVHSRDACKDTMDIIISHEAKKVGGVIHCFSYSKEVALQYVEMGFFIGLGGVVTFKNAKKALEVAAAIPLNSLLLETDCPYMAPVPNRGKRNQSDYLDYVAEKIAEIRGMTKEEVCRVTYENALRMYRIEK